MFKFGLKGKLSRFYVVNCDECGGEDYVDGEHSQSSRKDARNKFVEVGWINQGGIWYHLKCLLKKKEGNDK